jgi:PadR family transcriptional regulator, regulatory protein PadR
VADAVYTFMFPTKTSIDAVAILVSVPDFRLGILLPVDFLQEDQVVSCWSSTRGTQMAQTRNEIMPGTLNLMVLKTLHTIGPLHGYGIARRIEQISGDVVQLNQGTIYPALLQLEQMGWIKSKWGASENNRRAKYYSITRRGLKQLTAEEESWRRTSEVMLRFLATAEEK